MGQIFDFQVLVTLTLDRVILHTSCISRRPLPTYQISLKSKKLCGWTGGRTFETVFNRSTRRSLPKNGSHTLIWWSPFGGVVCHMARQWPIHVQNLTTSFSHSRDLIGTTKKLNRSRYFTTPLSGMICHLWAKICNLPTKFEASISTCFKDMKGDTNCRNSGGLRQLGVTQRRWKQDVALTGRITTGPPSRISYVAYAPPWSVTDDDRRQTASLVWPICVGGPVIIQ